MGFLVNHVRFFFLPPDVNLDAVPENCFRVLVSGEHQDTAYIVDRAGGTQKQVLPPDFVDAPLLVLIMDQGSIGTAAAGFTDQYLHCLILYRWDTIHRLIRDIKGPHQRMCVVACF